MADYSKVPSPCFVVEEELLRRNLSIISKVAEEAEVDIIVALKANATWTLFPIMREYLSGATASSLAEAMLVRDKFGVECHAYAPVYTDNDIEPILDRSSHITFNSLSQYRRFGQRALLRGVSCGLRINPEHSTVGTCLYNPCSPGSRLGITSDLLPELPAGIEGLHFHTLCESGPEELAATLEVVESKFGHLLPELKWFNMGGGHLMTRKNYNIPLLIRTLREFRERHPNLRIILEPGSAFTWHTGVLVSTIEDVVYNNGIDTLMVDVSFACHMPDTLEMPYKPAITGAREPGPEDKKWRIGGNCCLAGDYMGDWAFDREPKIGDRIIFEDMIHYTMVKTTMFNGVAHPSIAIRRMDGTVDVVRRFGYEDYRDRMS